MTLDHIGELPEVQEYQESRQGGRPLSTHPEGLWHTVERTVADAALAAADREAGRLKQLNMSLIAIHEEMWDTVTEDSCPRRCLKEWDSAVREAEAEVTP